jgi:hypothetical protein
MATVSVGDTIRNWADTTSRYYAISVLPYTLAIADSTNNVKGKSKHNTSSLQDHLGNRDVVTIAFLGGVDVSLQFTDVLDMEDDQLIDDPYILNDSFTIADSVSLQLFHPLTHGSSFSLTDDVAVAFSSDTLTINIGDALFLSDTPHLANTSYLFSDSLLMTDVFSLGIGFFITSGDVLSMDDVHTPVNTKNLGLDDSINITDDIAIDGAENLQLSLGDDMDLFDDSQDSIQSYGEVNYLRRYLNDVWQ